MPRDGSGIFNLVAGNPVSTQTTIDSTWANTTLADAAAGLTQSLSKDGQTVPTGNLPMGGFRHTNVSDGVARTQYASVGQVSDQATSILGTISGTNTITASLTPAISGYVTGSTYTLIPANNNTGAVTIAINGLSAKSLVKDNGTALIADDLIAGMPCSIVYNGTSFYVYDTLYITGSRLTGIPAGSIANNAVTTVKILDNNVTVAKIQQITSDRLIGRDTASTGNVEELTVGGGIEFTGSGGIQRSALSGDASASAGSATLTLATVNSNVGTFTSLTVNGKGLVTSATNPVVRSEVRTAYTISGNQAIDMSLGNLHDLTLNASTTLTFSNVPSGVYTAVFFLRQGTGGSRTVTWPAAVKWSDDTAPVLITTTGKMDAVSITTYDGGTSWFGGQIIGNLTI